MKKALLGLSILISTLAYAQETTTFILVRHAEKAINGTTNPGLSSTGKARAQRLADLLSKANITAIYATNFNRTLQTVAPLATAKNLTTQLYEWKSPKAFLVKLLETYRGGTVVICGHSNTTPILANALLGQALFEPFEDNEYSHLLIITASKVGAGKLLPLEY